MPSITRDRTLLVLLAILLLATWLRFYRIDAQSFWHDEGNSAGLAQRDLPRIIAGAAGDIHPPGYYVLLAGWVSVFGTQGELPYRSFSAACGVALVGVVFLLGGRLFGRSAGLLAALAAAVNPFQVYYSQEARMYALMALLGALSILGLLLWTYFAGSGRISRFASALIVFANALGLYTHYVFPVMLAVQNLAWLVWWVRRSSPKSEVRSPESEVRSPESEVRSPTSGDQTTETGLRTVDSGLPTSDAGLRTPDFAPLGAGKLFVSWAVIQLIALALYAPWLPTAFHQLTTWPASPTGYDLGTALVDTFRLLNFGSVVGTEQMALGLICAGFFVLLGLRREPGDDEKAQGGVGLPALWLLGPVALVFALGLYQDAFIKFFLVASAPACLLLAHGVTGIRSIVQRARAIPGLRWSPWLWAGLGIFTLAMFANQTITALQAGYFPDPEHARDDYRGIAAYIRQIERPDDAIMFLAANQWEVFTFYYPDDGRLFPLARKRPLDPVAEAAELESIAAAHRRLFVLYWAAEQADPEGFVTGWLDAHTYQAGEQWYGGVRLAIYGVPPAQGVAENEHPLDARFGETIALRGYALRGAPAGPGDIVELTLFWEAQAPVSERLKVFVHLVDDSGNIVAQHDAEPGDTTAWAAGKQAIDRHGLLVPLDAATGTYYLRVGLYPADDPSTRLPASVAGQAAGEWVTLADVQVGK
jgi:hypothetical protein